MDSLQTRLAGIAARDATATWDRHRGQCLTCKRAAADRAWGDLCAEGGRLFEEKWKRDGELYSNQKADKAPIPGQLTLL